MTELAPKRGPWREIVQPFIDLVHAPRALWGINLGYLLEGMVYFGMLNYLAMHFTDFVFRGVSQPDVHSHHMVMILTAGITISMFFFGFVADKRGVRKALLYAFCLMLVGRFIISAAPTLFGLQPAGLWSPLQIVTIAGILCVVLGYGMYQPAAYAGVRQFTSPRTAGMAFAMLYALMNMGGYLPTYAFLLREDKYLGLGIVGTYWVYTGVTVLSLLATFFILSPRTEREAIARAEAERQAAKAAAEAEAPAGNAAAAPATERDPARPVPRHLWVFLAVILAALGVAARGHRIATGLWLALLAASALVAAVPAWRRPVRAFIANHPLGDAKFFFFIFALIPVQTLFTYNWFIIPQYVSRAYTGWVGEKFEIASNFNPLLVFIFVPIVAALTQKKRVYDMMIAGTFVMAAPAFLLSLGTNAYLLFSFLVIMTIGEAMWQPRFLQYAAEIAPAGRTGEYMGVAQLPWFLTKMLVPIYSGHIMTRYCPDPTTLAAGGGQMAPQRMWFYFGLIAMVSTVLLLLARGWVGKGFKTRAD